MSFVSSIVVFTIFWWLTFFSLLPFGIKRENIVAPGQEKGAPSNPGLKNKFMITTLIALLLTALTYWISSNNWISLWT